MQNEIKTASMINLEKYLLKYLRNLDPIEYANKHNVSPSEVMEAIEILQRDNEIRKISLMIKLFYHPICYILKIKIQITLTVTEPYSILWTIAEESIQKKRYTFNSSNMFLIINSKPPGQ